MNPEVIIAVVAAAISGVAAIAAIVSGRLARVDAQSANRSANAAQSEANRVAQEAARLQALDWTTQYFEGVRAWGDDVTRTITEAMHLSRIRNDSTREMEWNRIRARLSASIDAGRWYFPNKYQDDYGTEKPPAYRGFRRRVLDRVVDAYKAMPSPPVFLLPSQSNDNSTGDEVYDTLETCKREFVSEIQQILNPRQREDQVAKVIERFNISDQMRSAKDDESEKAEVEKN